ncbi:MAG: modification methylase [Omnitrophica WOR_2 bacterium RBG_13_44_8b]|nr:MAG: modification methylase [Omnitrophica WOR_2 bacterium RBG_13_44_8b]
MLLLEQSKNIQIAEEIEVLSAKLENKFADIIVGDSHLSRQIVSFQANKQRPVYRWYKYKEGFSAELVHYLFDKYLVKNGNVLDPFAGVGTALFASKEEGYNAYGIELLPIGQEIIRTRKFVENGIKKDTLTRLEEWSNKKYWKNSKEEKSFVELRITHGAYSKETKKAIRQYLYAIDSESPQVKQILLFALLCVLESVSYTRKDGQYLRWDYRSGRTCGEKPFDKGEIQSFDKAITSKLKEILSDLSSWKMQTDLFKLQNHNQGSVFLYESSCLDQLPKLQNNLFAAIITSPPYCNRYDYTRTYALELAMLGIDEENLRTLRQKMLSCTVENKEKDLLAVNPAWEMPLAVAKDQKLLHEILAYLEYLKEQNQLNNDGILRMVKGYFYEMSCVIYECSRIIQQGGYFFMVNDNVKYAGISISVDLILSDLASCFGFEIKNILVLPQGKGNSSQQMGQHGREVLRKCVYAWRKR